MKTNARQEAALLAKLEELGAAVQAGRTNRRAAIAEFLAVSGDRWDAETAGKVLDNWRRIRAEWERSRAVGPASADQWRVET